MKPSLIKATLKCAYNANPPQPMMLWGSPGTAKSSVAKQTADELGVSFIDLRLSLLDPVDLRGFPMIDKTGKMNFAAPIFLPNAGKGILMLDELAQAASSVQAAASQLILDRRCGEYVLPKGWMVMGASNKKSDRASTNEMPMHIRNRFVHLQMEVSLDEWVAWALAHDVDIRIIAFLKWRPQLLYTFDPTAKGEAFASPRSWEFLSRLLKVGVPDECLLDVVKGAVGEGPAAEFVAFLRIFERLPSLDAIILNPAQAEVPGDPATLYAVASALVTRATKDNLNKIAIYMGRVKDAGRPEFPVIALREVATKKPELTNTRAYVEWASSLSALIA